MNDLVFGTDNLQDDAAKLTKIYLRVKGGTLSNDEYKHLKICCTVSDATTLDFFTNVEGNKRVAATVLLCAGLSKLYSVIQDYPISIFDISQVFGRIVLINKVNWVLEDKVRLKLSDAEYRSLSAIKHDVYIPNELWGMINKISMDFGLYLTDLILYLSRTGVAEYNNFIERSSRSVVQIPLEYLGYAEHSEVMLLQTLGVRYSDYVGRIKYLYSTYGDILDDGHTDLKEEMKRIIDKE